MSQKYDQVSKYALQSSLPEGDRLLIDQIMKLFHKDYAGDKPADPSVIDKKLQQKQLEQKQLLAKHLQTMVKNLREDSAKQKQRLDEVKDKLEQSTQRKDHALSLLQELQSKKLEADK